MSYQSTLHNTVNLRTKMRREKCSVRDWKRRDRHRLDDYCNTPYFLILLVEAS